MRQKVINIICFVALLSLIATSFISRFSTIPWDFGGCFFHGWVAGGSLMLFGFFLPEAFPKGRTVLKILLLPLITSLLFGSLYFAPQSLFPFLLVGIAILVIAFLFIDGHTQKAWLSSLVFLPLFFWCYTAIHHMAIVQTLKNLQNISIEFIALTPPSWHNRQENLMINNPTVIKNIAVALHETYPYSPNHEGIVDPWNAKIVFTSGEQVNIKIGNGNKAHPQAIWIEFDVESYQNLQLRQVFEQLEIMLW